LGELGDLPLLCGFGVGGSWFKLGKPQRRIAAVELAGAALVLYLQPASLIAGFAELVLALAVHLVAIRVTGEESLA